MSKIEIQPLVVPLGPSSQYVDRSMGYVERRVPSDTFARGAQDCYEESKYSSTLRLLLSGRQLSLECEKPKSWDKKEEKVRRVLYDSPVSENLANKLREAPSFQEAWGWNDKGYSVFFENVVIPALVYPEKKAILEKVEKREPLYWQELWGLISLAEAGEKEVAKALHGHSLETLLGSKDPQIVSADYSVIPSILSCLSKYWPNEAISFVIHIYQKTRLTPQDLE